MTPTCCLSAGSTSSSDRTTTSPSSALSPRPPCSCSTCWVSCCGGPGGSSAPAPSSGGALPLWVFGRRGRRPLEGTVPQRSSAALNWSGRVSRMFCPEAHGLILPPPSPHLPPAVCWCRGISGTVHHRHHGEQLFGMGWHGNECLCFLLSSNSIHSFVTETKTCIAYFKPAFQHYVKDNRKKHHAHLLYFRSCPSFHHQHRHHITLELTSSGRWQWNSVWLCVCLCLLQSEPLYVPVKFQDVSADHSSCLMGDCESCESAPNAV